MFREDVEAFLEWPEVVLSGLNPAKIVLVRTKKKKIKRNTYDFEVPSNNTGMQRSKISDVPYHAGYSSV